MVLVGLSSSFVWDVFGRYKDGQPSNPYLYLTRPFCPSLHPRFALGTLVQARERELMAHWAELLRNILPHRLDACLWLLNELGRFPTILKELVLSPEDTVRQAVALVAGVALRQCMLTASGAGDGGRSEDGNDDVYRAAYMAAVREQEEFVGWQGGEKLAQGFVAVGQEDVAAEAEDDDARLARKTVRSFL